MSVKRIILYHREEASDMADLKLVRIHVGQHVNESREFVREVCNAVAGISPSKCGIVVEYFEKPRNVAVELRTKGQEEKEIGDKKGFCAVVFIPRANTTQGNLIRLSLSAAASAVVPSHNT